MAAFLHCLSHALSNAGKKLFCQEVHDFLCQWNMLVGHSVLLQRAYFDYFLHVIPRLLSAIRWFVEWEEIRDLLRDSKNDRLRLFLVQFIAGRGSDAPITAERCRNFLTGPDRHALFFGLIVITFHGRALCKSCYFLEGDGMLWPYAASKLEQCLASLDPETPLTAEESVYVQNYSRLMGINFDAQTVAVWKAKRDSILRPAHVWLQQIMPPREPFPAQDTPNKSVSRSLFVASRSHHFF